MKIMAMNKPMKVSRRKKSNLIPVLIMLVFALLLSLLIAGVWQISAGAQGENASSDASRQRLRSSSSEPEEKEESSDDEPEPASAPKPEPEPEIPVFEGAVPASDWVSSDYFNDAVFVGDSISTGIELCNGWNYRTRRYRGQPQQHLYRAVCQAGGWFPHCDYGWAQTGTIPQGLHPAWRKRGARC